MNYYRYMQIKRSVARQQREIFIAYLGLFVLAAIIILSSLNQLI